MPKKKSGRASNGMGSIRQRADGRWEARYSTPTGQQKSVYAKTEKEVTQKLRQVLHDLDTGNWHEPSKIVVKDWFATWLKDYQPHTIERTRKLYERIARIHILPVIGEIKLKNVSTAHVRRVMSSMQEKKLSAVLIEHTQTIMSSAFRCAIEAGLMTSNPAHGVKLPRRPKKKMTIVDRELIPAFIEAAMQEKYYGYPLIFLLLTGLRISEERGLRWSDFDESAATLNIERQLYPTYTGEPFSPPKDESRRTIELPDEAVEVLKKVRVIQAENKMAAGASWIDNNISRGLIFRTRKGNYINKNSLADALHRVGKAIGLPNLHPHDLRHSYAVAALRSGIDVKTVQNNLGHKNAYMTLDVYAVYTTDAGRAGAKKFSEYWKQALAKNDEENKEK